MNTTHASGSFSSRNVSLDIAKLILAACVIGLHADLLMDSAPYYGNLLVNGIFRIAVPFFFIVNGYFLPLQRASFNRWFFRVGTLYFAWMMIYAWAWAPTFPITPTGLLKLAKVWLFGHHHLWYLAAMLPAGALIFATKGQPKLTATIAAIALLGGISLQYSSFLQIVPGSIGDFISYNWVHRNFLFTGLPYMFLGLIMRQREAELRAVSTGTISAVFITSMGLLIAEATLIYAHQPAISGFDNLFMIAPVAASLFLLTCVTRVLSPYGKLLATLSTSMYLIHPAILQAVRSQGDSLTSSGQFIITLALTVFVSVGVVRVSRTFRWLL